MRFRETSGTVRGGRRKDVFCEDGRLMTQRAKSATPSRVVPFMRPVSHAARHDEKAQRELPMLDAADNMASALREWELDRHEAERAGAWPSHLPPHGA